MKYSAATLIFFGAQQSTTVNNNGVFAYAPVSFVPRSTVVGSSSFVNRRTTSSHVPMRSTATSRRTANNQMKMLVNSGRRPIQKIAIIGSGIAGLSLAHALVNNNKKERNNNNNNMERGNKNNNQQQPIRLPLYEISIYDSRTTFESGAGAGVQLNGGLGILGKINPSVQQSVYDAGIVSNSIESRCKAWFPSVTTSESQSQLSSTTTDRMDLLLKLNLFDVVQKAGGEIAESLLRTKDNQLNWIAIMRGAIQQTLLDTLPTDNKNVQLHLNKKLINFYYDEDTDSNSNDDNDDASGGGVICSFDDGAKSGPFDIIIGCDGINSKVKSFIENGKFTTNTPTVYSGIRIRYAVADGDGNKNKLKDDDTLQQQPKESTTILKQYFGDGAYALHGTYGAGKGIPPSDCSFIVYLDKNYIGPFRKQSSLLSSSEDDSDKNTNKRRNTKKIREENDDENVDWKQDNREEIEIARTKMFQQLHDSNIPVDPIQDPLGRTITNADRFFELGVYFHNPFGKWYRPILSSSSSGSHSRFAVLCGDAAHACPPFLGQGSNQAIQDAYCLATKIHTYNEQFLSGDTIQNAEEVDFQTLLQDYQSIRFPPTFGVFWKALFLGYLETGGPNGIYSKLRDVIFRVLGFLGIAERVLLSAATPKVE